MSTNGQNDRCNGFRVRGFNADTDRLAVQSSHQSSFFLTRRRWNLPGIANKWHDVGLSKHEVVVMRAYGGAPEIEIEALGDRFGVLIVDCTQTATRTLRVGSRMRVQMKRDEAIVIKNEDWVAPDLRGQHA